MEQIGNDRQRAAFTLHAVAFAPGDDAQEITAVGSDATGQYAILRTPSGVEPTVLYSAGFDIIPTMTGFGLAFEPDRDKPANFGDAPVGTLSTQGESILATRSSSPSR